MTEVVSPQPRPSIVVDVPARVPASVETNPPGAEPVVDVAPPSNVAVNLDFVRGPQGPPGPPGPQGPAGTSVTILGTLPNAESLPFPGNLGDAYMIDGSLYVWSATSSNWVNVGNIQGPPGPGVADMKWVGPELIVTLQDGTVINAGHIEGLDGNGWLTEEQVEGVASSVVQEHIESAEPHPVYDDLPSLTLLFENKLGGI